MSNLLTLSLGISVNATGLFYITLPFITNGYELIRYGSTTRRLPFKFIFPFDVYKPPLYEFSYILFTYSAFNAAFSLIAMDSLFLGVCFHLAAQFEIIATQINNLLKSEEFGDTTNITKFTEQENKVIYKKLVKCVFHHNFIINLCNQMVKIFRPIVLLHFVSASIMICISSVNIILADSFSIFMYISFLLVVVTQLYFYSFSGTRITETSLNLSQIIYFFEWYKTDKNVRQVILLIMIRSQKELCNNFLFFQPSRQCFASILRSAGSYMALLKTFL